MTGTQPKYMLINQRQATFADTTKRLHGIIALRDFGYVRRGDLGGYVEGEHNLSHEGNCWIYPGGYVMDNARVSESAIVGKYAIVAGNARIFGNAHLSINALVRGNAKVFGNACIAGSTVIVGDTELGGCTQIGEAGAEPVPVARDYEVQG